MGLVDVHAHLTDSDLLASMPQVIDNARAAGLTRIISNGLTLQDDLQVQQLAAREEMVRPAYGLYPVDAVVPEMLAAGVEYPWERESATAEETVEWIREHVGEAIALGEIGLDGHWVPDAFWDRQEEVFRALLQVALDADKPVIIHSRKREKRCLEILQEMGVTRADFHCFGSKVKLAARIADAGYYLSIPANARRAQNFAAMLRRLPRDRLLLETDCPYLSPDREKLPRNEPASVRVTAEFAAELWDEPLDSVTAIFEDNYRRLFREEP